MTSDEVNQLIGLLQKFSDAAGNQAWELQCLDDLAQLRKRIIELEDQIEIQDSRNRGMAGNLSRIRAKADEALGLTEDQKQRNDYGRGAGAEGAVDLLLARYAGALARKAMEEAPDDE